MAGPWEQYAAAPADGPWAQYAKLPSKAQQDTDAWAKTLNPTEGQSFLENARQGIGMGMAKVGRAVGQAVGLVDQAEIDEANRLDAPLAATGGGKFGNVVGQGAIAAPAMLLPGANTYVGAALIGSGVGGLTTEGGLVDRAKGAAGGAIGGFLGKGAGDALGAGAKWVASKFATSNAATNAANAGKNAAFVAARDAGYVVPPADVKPSMFNEVLNGASGKIKTAQEASARNQNVTNSLIKDEFKIPQSTVLSRAEFDAIRQKAGSAYDAVSNAGVIKPGAAYDAALDKIAAPYAKAAQGFPNAKPSPILAEVEALRSPQFDASSAVAKIKTLRSAADEAYAAGNKDLGKALKDGSKALEDAIDDHLVANGAPATLLKDFREARQLIAKTYSAQKGLNDVTGDVSANALAKMLEKGKPLSGNLRTVAETAATFPKALQSLKEAPKATSPLDVWAATGASMASGNVAPMALLAARPTARSLMLSKFYQNRLNPEVGNNALSNLLLNGAQSPLLRYGLPGGAMLSAEAAK
jgi:hypothetical protein